MSAAPLELRSDAASRTLTLRWADGSLSTLEHAVLRDACPCAGCRTRRLAGEPVVKDAEVSVTDIRPMGYGVQLVFDDGHDRGIFPWPFLAALATAPA